MKGKIIFCLALWALASSSQAEERILAPQSMVRATSIFEEVYLVNIGFVNNPQAMEIRPFFEVKNGYPEIIINSLIMVNGLPLSAGVTPVIPYGDLKWDENIIILQFKDINGKEFRFEEQFKLPYQLVINKESVTLKTREAISNIKDLFAVVKKLTDLKKTKSDQSIEVPVSYNLEIGIENNFSKGVLIPSFKLTRNSDNLDMTSQLKEIKVFVNNQLTGGLKPIPHNHPAIKFGSNLVKFQFIGFTGQSYTTNPLEIVIGVKINRFRLFTGKPEEADVFQIVFSNQLFFDTDQAIIKPEYLKVLENIEFPTGDMTLLVGGADPRQTPEYNRNLIKRRIKALEGVIPKSGQLVRLNLGEGLLYNSKGKPLGEKAEENWAKKHSRDIDERLEKYRIGMCFILRTIKRGVVLEGLKVVEALVKTKHIPQYFDNTSNLKEIRKFIN